MLGHSIQNCLKLSSSTHHEGLDKVTRKGQSAMQHHKHKTKDSMVDKQPELTTEHHIEEVAPEPVHKSDLLTAQHFSKVMEESPVQRNIEKEGDKHDETVKSVTTKEKASSPTLATHNSYVLLTDECDIPTGEALKRIILLVQKICRKISMNLTRMSLGRFLV